jgi:hypothetical protein
VKTSTEVVVGDPVTAIVAAASKADSVVMTTLGQTGVARWLIGSVAERVVRMSPSPQAHSGGNAREHEWQSGRGVSREPSKWHHLGRAWV